MDKSPPALQPLYLKVKRHILENIGSGRWTASSRVPSENELVKSFGVSRMTANRALKELSDEGILVRIAGVGSFVADRHARAHPLEIRSIADEIRERGHVHRAETVSLERLRAAAGSRASVARGDARRAHPQAARHEARRTLFAGDPPHLERGSNRLGGAFILSRFPLRNVRALPPL